MMTTAKYEQCLHLEHMCSKVDGKWMCVARELMTSNAAISSHFAENYDTVIRRSSRNINKKQAIEFLIGVIEMGTDIKKFRCIII